MENEKETPAHEIHTLKTPLSKMLSQPLEFYSGETRQDVLFPHKPFLPSKPMDQEEQEKRSAFLLGKTQAQKDALRGDSRSFLETQDTIPIQVIKGIKNDVKTPNLTVSNNEKEQQFSEMVASYFSWLVREATRPLNKKDQEEKDLYTQESLHSVKKNGQEILTFAPFRPELSAFQTFTKMQLVVFFLLGIAWLFGLYLFKIEMITILIGVITTIYTLCLFLNVFLVLRLSGKQTEEQFDDELVRALDQAPWPRYTILCPLYKEVAIVPQFVDAMSKLDYPVDKLQILLLTEENDRETRKVIRSLQLPKHFEIIVVPDGQPRTKPRACNYGLLKATGDYTVIYDAEDIPEPLQLKKAVLSFANNQSDTVCVQAKLNFYNANQNLLTRWFTAEYSTWFGFSLPALQRAGFVLPLGGTSNHFRTTSLRALGGWDAYNVTEDCDLGLRLKRFQMKTVVLDSTTLEEANPNFKNWFRQRSRWIKGYMQTYLVHMRHPFQAIQKGRAKDFLSFQTIIGSGIGVLFFNPLMWILLAIYIAAGTKAVDLYHLLFPGPFLYAGAFCLIFGNFFYVYLYLLGCEKREKYNLLLSTLFIPFYWLCMSAAGIYAFFELLIKPHYWQKTIHGFNIKGMINQRLNETFPIGAVTQTNVSIPAISVIRQSTPRVVRSITTAMKAIKTVPMPVVKKKEVRRKKDTQTLFWFIFTFLFCLTAGIVSLHYFFQQHETIIYGDGLSHLMISRRVFDSATPGIAQLGGVWLPLPHILMWPFIWNNYLWESGLAGSFVGLFCFLVANSYIFFSIKKLSNNNFASFLGCFIFSTNPNILFLQSTPMTEPVCWATYTMACYYMLVWVQTGKTKYLTILSLATFLATLARYDGWILVVTFPLVLVIVGIQKKYSFKKIFSYVGLFSLIGSLGIILWLAWGLVIFGDPLYFQRGPYSSQTQTASGTLAINESVTKHNFLVSAKFYGIDTIETIGIFLFSLTIISIITYLIRNFKKKEITATIAYLIPFLFYVIAVYTGQVALFDNAAKLYINGTIPSSADINLFNSRFGSEMVAPCAIFIALFLPCLFQNIQKKFLKKLLFFSGYTTILFLTVFQSLLLFQGGIVSEVSNNNPPFCVGSYAINAYLSEHYEGGYILQTEYPFQVSVGESNINFSNVIWEGSGKIWNEALKNPSSVVDWIIFTPQDSVSIALQKNDPTFIKDFTEVEKSPYGIRLYHKNGKPMANQPVSSFLADEKSFCTIGNYRKK